MTGNDPNSRRIHARCNKNNPIFITLIFVIILSSVLRFVMFREEYWINKYEEMKNELESKNKEREKILSVRVDTLREETRLEREEFLNKYEEMKNELESKNKENEKILSIRVNTLREETQLAREELQLAREELRLALDSVVSKKNYFSEYLSYSANDVVISLAFYKSEDIFKSFLGSLRCAGYTGDIVLAVFNECLSKTCFTDIFDHYSVIAVPWDELQKKSCNGIDDKDLDDAIVFTMCKRRDQVEVARYAFYKQVIEYYSNNAKVLLADFRDIWFQDNPFSDPNISDLVAFAEWEGEKIGGYDMNIVRNIDNHTGPLFESINTVWVKRCFGIDEKVRNKSVLCSGTTMGKVIGIRRYLDAFLQKVLVMTPKKQGCTIKGIDQGFHMYLIHSGEAGNVTIQKQGEGIVNTMGRICSRLGHLFPLDNVDEEGYVLNKDGSRSKVLHQYDRCSMKDGSKAVDHLNGPIWENMKANCKWSRGGYEY